MPTESPDASSTHSDPQAARGSEAAAPASDPRRAARGCLVRIVALVIGYFVVDEGLHFLHRARIGDPALASALEPFRHDFFLFSELYVCTGALPLWGRLLIGGLVWLGISILLTAPVLRRRESSSSRPSRRRRPRAVTGISLLVLALVFGQVIFVPNGAAIFDREARVVRLRDHHPLLVGSPLASPVPAEIARLPFADLRGCAYDVVGAPSEGQQVRLWALTDAGERLFLGASHRELPTFADSPADPALEEVSLRRAGERGCHAIERIVGIADSVARGSRIDPRAGGTPP